MFYFLYAIITLCAVVLLNCVCFSFFDFFWGTLLCGVQLLICIHPKRRKNFLEFVYHTSIEILKNKECCPVFFSKFIPYSI